MATLSETDQSIAPPVVGERVLIVEDDPATRVGLSELVGAWGFQTDEAANGEEALQKVTSFRPAIIVSDLVMPRMGGLELLRSLKDQLSDLTLILLTAQGTVESAVEAIKEGAYDYLSKPVDPARLRILLQKAVERQETLREVKNLRRQLREHGSFGRIIGNSPSIRAIDLVLLPSSGSRSTSMRPLHPSPSPHAASSSARVSYVTTLASSESRTCRACSARSASRHPPLTMPIVDPSGRITMRVPTPP